MNKLYVKSREMENYTESFFLFDNNLQLKCYSYTKVNLDKIQEIYVFVIFGHFWSGSIFWGNWDSCENRSNLKTKQSRSLKVVKLIQIACFDQQYRWTSLYARDRDSTNMLAYNEFAYKKTNDHCKLQDRFQKKGHFPIAYTWIRR